MGRAAPLGAAILGLLLAAPAALGGNAGEAGGPFLRAPAIRIPALSGGWVSLSQFRGKVVIVDFWATWCPPCGALISNLAALHRAYGEKGLVILGIALDREGAEVVAPFVRQERVPFPVLLGNREVRDAFGRIESLPTTFIIDREGRIVRRMVGYHTYEEVENECAPLLRREAGEGRGAATGAGETKP